MRLISLDLLRALAVLLVLGRHMMPCPREQSAIAWAITSTWRRMGWVGVDLFFVLSGFLVSRLLFREYLAAKQVNVSRFLIRRAFKIYPAFWGMLLTSILCIELSGSAVSQSALLGEVFFLQNYLGRIWEHTWSLAVEEHFYLLIAGMTLLWVSRARGQDDPFVAVPVAFAVIATTCLGLRWLVAVTVPYSYDTHHYPTHLRIDALFCGVLVEYLSDFQYSQFKAHQLLCRAMAIVGFIALLALPAAFTLERTVWMQHLGLSLVYGASALLLAGSLTIQISERGMFGWLARLGTYSYSIYLWHIPLHTVALDAIDPSTDWMKYMLVYFGGSVLVGIGATLIVEAPMLRLRDQLCPAAGKSRGSVREMDAVACSGGSSDA